MVTVQDFVEAGMSREDAEDLAAKIDLYMELPSPTERWNNISRHLLRSDFPFAVHKALFDRAYAGWDQKLGPPPAWIPSEQEIRSTHVHELMAAHGCRSYEEMHAWSTRNRHEFWNEMVERLGIVFDTPPTTVVDPKTSVEAPDWFPGARLNIAKSCFSAAEEEIAISVGLPTASLMRSRIGWPPAWSRTEFSPERR